MDINLLGDIQNKSRDVMFFNPKLAAFKLSLSLTNMSMQISMARSIDPGRSGRIEKNQKVYDWDNQAYFSCSSEECVHISKNLGNLMKGIYKNPSVRKDNFPESLKNSITVDHFRDNKLSRLSLSQGKDKEGNSTGALKITIYPPKGSGEIVNYYLRENEMKIFMEFCKHCAIDLPYHASLASGYIKLLKQALYDNKNSNNNGNNNRSNNKKDNYEEQSLPENVETFGDEGDDDSSGNDDGGDDLDFGF
jgi:hypothetical protein